MSQTPIARSSISNSTIRSPNQNKKKLVARPIQKARTLPSATPFSSSASFSSSSSSNEVEVGVNRLVPLAYYLCGEGRRGDGLQLESQIL